MRVFFTFLLLVAAVSSFTSQPTRKTHLTSHQASVGGYPGIVAPLGFFDPLSLAESADANTLKRYRESELTHGRVAMLATVGFIVGEKAPLLAPHVKGPAITHFTQAPIGLSIALFFFVVFIEVVRAEVAFVEPENVPIDKPGLIRRSYIPGDLRFDPLGLKPSNPLKFREMQTKELQNGRLAMIAAAGFMAQELVTKKPIL